MFIPLELNLPLLVGGAVNWYVTTRSKDEAVNAERGEKGTLLASGFIAGGALMGGCQCRHALWRYQSDQRRMAEQPVERSAVNGRLYPPDHMAG